ncbi:hypothetical protein TNCT_32631 [Trichonephila clavata]|uniref:Uncharacterized protein n=1 Tax=Trichonephila clavata TaxID=2740835 RepID=A0A8X6GZG4_TRICU|nr:hypothetical protein TNCT_32631 [Trichonephila clavata]
MVRPRKCNFLFNLTPQGLEGLRLTATLRNQIAKSGYPQNLPGETSVEHRGTSVSMERKRSEEPAKP